jgi:hypothetical protein
MSDVTCPISAHFGLFDKEICGYQEQLTIADKLTSLNVITDGTTRVTNRLTQSSSEQLEELVGVQTVLKFSEIYAT